MNNKIILVIADGAGDRPCEELGWKTPLEYAQTPNLDTLAQAGCTGIMDIYRAGIPVGTDVGHMLLLGYDLSDYPQRGPIEAFGTGMELRHGDIAMRSNFATISEDHIITDRRAGRINEEGSALAKALNGLKIKDTSILCGKSAGHRVAIVLRGGALSCAITDADPKRDGLPIRKVLPTDDTQAALYTAGVVNELIEKAQEILGSHPVNKSRLSRGLSPANAILTRGAGFLKAIPSFGEKSGISSAIVTGTTTIIGIGYLTGMNVITDPSFTGMYGTNIEKKAAFAAAALDDCRFVLLHYKATDQMGHDGDPKGKVKAIEEFDCMIGFLREEIARRDPDENVILAITSDHSTPCEHKDHSGDPVPVLIHAKNFRRDDVTSFNEISCSSGGLGRIRAKDLYFTLMDYLETNKKIGN